jgi:alkanesulfonate monooxygenase SsuD/methylene tetrahydromethanopterin reductase-like flavin-dependent oxidoreductase (luciferase family)
MRRAATLGDGWHPYMYTADQCRESFVKVKSFAEEAGRTLPDDYVWAVFIYTSLFDDVKEARKYCVDEMSYRYDQDFSKLVDKYAAFGPPEKIAEELAAYIEAGVNYFILAPIMPPDQRRAHLERLAHEVLPALEKIEPGRVP